MHYAKLNKKYSDMKPIRKARLRKRYIVVSQVVYSRLTELKTLLVIHCRVKS